MPNGMTGQPTPLVESVRTSWVVLGLAQFSPLGWLAGFTSRKKGKSPLDVPHLWSGFDFHLLFTKLGTSYPSTSTTICFDPSVIFDSVHVVKNLLITPQTSFLLINWSLTFFYLWPPWAYPVVALSCLVPLLRARQGLGMACMHASHRRR